MTYHTSSGKVITSITIKPEVRDGLRKRGIPIGTACELWLENIDKIKEDNRQIRIMEENVARLQKLLQRQSDRILELETKEGVKK